MLKASASESFRAEREREKRQHVVLVQSAIIRVMEICREGFRRRGFDRPPPYPKEYLHTWAELAEFAAYALRPGGHLLAMSGQMWLPEVMDAMNIPELDLSLDAVLEVASAL